MTEANKGVRTITDLVEDSHERAKRKGWWDDCIINESTTLAVGDLDYKGGNMTAANETEAAPFSTEEMRGFVAMAHNQLRPYPHEEARAIATAAALEREMNQIASGRETITDLVIDSHERAKRKGWWDDCIINESTTLAVGDLDYKSVLAKVSEKIALIHSEASEALEDYREGTMTTVLDGNKKPVGFPSELADICIRVFDLAGALGIDLEKEIALKARFNETRPARHGGKKC